MATILARKLFSRRVSITGGTAISLANLMKSAPGVTGTPAWGKNADGSISMDSFSGDGGTIIPVTGDVYFGFDSQVADADAAGTYKGVPAVAEQPFSLTDFCRGIVDANQVWIFSATSQDVDVIFQGI